MHGRPAVPRSVYTLQLPYSSRTLASSTHTSHACAFLHGVADARCHREGRTARPARVQAESAAASAVAVADELEQTGAPDTCIGASASPRGDRQDRAPPTGDAARPGCGEGTAGPHGPPGRSGRGGAHATSDAAGAVGAAIGGVQSAAGGCTGDAGSGGEEGRRCGRVEAGAGGGAAAPQRKRRRAPRRAAVLRDSSDDESDGTEGTVSLILYFWAGCAV